jgi:hypothetical protein
MGAGGNRPADGTANSEQAPPLTARLGTATGE